ncbi:MAG TPA: hypothetical protein VIJ34_07380 [Acidimicrobiales bacterium]
MSPTGATEAAQRTRTSRPPEKRRHAGIGLHTPASVHYGTATEIRAERARTLDAAYATNPRRFCNRRPTPPKLPTVAWINNPAMSGDLQK